jgi:O-acetyl-ADP-ribose deacetylase (regulator of RNase III)
MTPKKVSTTVQNKGSVRGRRTTKKRKERTCFVIMPFGIKDSTPSATRSGHSLWQVVGLDKSDKETVNKIDFDDIYSTVIRRALLGIKDYDIKVTRCDKIKYSGWIHEKMIEQIANADIAIVELTTLNPNVFYELGVRHALNESVTVLIQQKNLAEKIPFNLGGMSIVMYDPKNLGSAREEIKQAVTESLTRQEHQDSLVFKTLPDLRVRVSRPRPLDRLKYIDFALSEPDGKRSLGVVTGDIANVKKVDIWVSSENTEMMMARYHEMAISATVRYLGAERDETGHVKDDIIKNALMEKMRDANCVPAGSVVVTTAGKLRVTNDVQWIFHAASVLGQVSRGYTPIPNVTSCITNALRMADSEEFRAEHHEKFEKPVQSILFPILGTGQAGADPEDAVASLMHTARTYLEQTEDSTLKRVYFLAFTDRDEKICKRVLESFGLEERTLANDT